MQNHQTHQQVGTQNMLYGDQHIANQFHNTFFHFSFTINNQADIKQCTETIEQLCLSLQQALTPPNHCKKCSAKSTK